MGIGQARESTHRHPHGQVLPFHMASRNVRRIRASSNSYRFAADALCGAVTLLRLRIVPVHDNRIMLELVKLVQERNGKSATVFHLRVGYVSPNVLGS